MTLVVVPPQPIQDCCAIANPTEPGIEIGRPCAWSAATLPATVLARPRDADPR